MDLLWSYGKKGIEPCYFIRKKVFVEEQGFDDKLEFDAVDAYAHHLLMRGEEGEPIATARLFLENEEFHCGRICVLRGYRGRQLGALIMQAIEEKTHELGGKSLSLSAQVRVEAFYEKAGYIREGEEYLDEFCPHIKMTKKI